ncbi:hypothetical protein HZC30_04825 [Candidatus Woesearchaeota archaeon]|nr:hypothetical protein [Candidatus Woesearchaeota archaeon]
MQPAKIKDLCDIFALLWYSHEKPPELREKVIQFLSFKNIQEIIASIDESDYQKAGVQLNHTASEIKRVVEILG